MRGEAQKVDYKRAKMWFERGAEIVSSTTRGLEGGLERNEELTRFDLDLGWVGRARELQRVGNPLQGWFGCVSRCCEGSRVLPSCCRSRSR